MAAVGGQDIYVPIIRYPKMISVPLENVAIADAGHRIFRSMPVKDVFVVIFRAISKTSIS